MTHEPTFNVINEPLPSDQPQPSNQPLPSNQLLPINHLVLTFSEQISPYVYLVERQMDKHTGGDCNYTAEFFFVGQKIVI